MLQPVYSRDIEDHSGVWYYAPGWYVGTVENGQRLVYTSEDNKGRLNTKAETERAIEALAEAGITTEDQLEASDDSILIPLIYRDLFW